MAHKPAGRRAAWRASSAPAWVLGGRSASNPPSPRHGWLRRNAVTPVGVRLSGAPGAPLGGPTNRVLLSKLHRDGIVAVPRNFTQAAVRPPARGCYPGKRASGSCPGTTLRLLSFTRGWIATHGGSQCVAAVSGLTGPRYRVDRSQATEIHGRTISERHSRTPRRA